MAFVLNFILDSPSDANGPEKDICEVLCEVCVKYL